MSELYAIFTTPLSFYSSDCNVCYEAILNGDKITGVKSIVYYKNIPLSDIRTKKLIGKIYNYDNSENKNIDIYCLCLFEENKGSYYKRLTVDETTHIKTLISAAFDKECREYKSIESKIKQDIEKGKSKIVDERKERNKNSRISVRKNVINKVKSLFTKH